MTKIKESSFFRNAFFSQKNRAPMQKYLNEMSDNGYHLLKLTRFKSVFTEEPGKRYLYAVGNEEDASLFAASGEWEHFADFKGAPLFRRLLPSDAVKTTRRFGKKQLTQQAAWLNMRLAEGLVLAGKCEDEFIFKRCEGMQTHRYHIKTADAPKKKKGESASVGFAAESEMTFACASEDGDTYYFIKDARAELSVKENRGKRLSDQIFALFIATGSALAFCASVLLALFGAFGAKTNSLSPLPWVIGGCSAALIFAGLFITFFLRFQKIAEIRKIRAEERRLREAAAENAPPEPAPEAPAPNQTTNNNSNTVVMNTVVLNCGKDGKPKPGAAPFDGNEEFDPALKAAMGQVFESTPALDPSANPALATARDPQALAAAVMQAASAGAQPKDYEDKTETENGDIWQGEQVFGTQHTSPEPIVDAYASSALAQPITADEPTEADGDEYEEAYDEDEEYEEDALYGGFSLIKFIGCAVLCFGAVIAAALGIRYFIHWFALGDSNTLLLVLAILGIVTAPFIFKYAFTVCKAMFTDFSEDDEQ